MENPVFSRGGYAWMGQMTFAEKNEGGSADGTIRITEHFLTFFFFFAECSRSLHVSGFLDVLK